MPGTAVEERAHRPHLLHLARRFLGALSPVAPAAEDEAWAASRLTGPERMLFASMANHDRRHAIGVARRATALRGDDAPDDLAAAALLHDVGKVHSRLGPVRRARATVRIAILGREHVRAQVARTEWTRRVALYADHPGLGAADLRARGGRARVAGWAAVHHDASRWSESGFDAADTAALAAADDD
jgi:predicted HD phosphohydrolase